MELLTKSPEETARLGERLAHQLKGGEILCLFGNLGSGKTTFTKGLAKGLKIDEKKVNSPTFVIMNMYEGKKPLYHFDFYRFDRPEEIGGVGYDEFLYGDGVAVIEWAERFGDLMPPKRLDIHFKYQDETHRAVTFKAHGEPYQELIRKLSV